MAKAKTYNIDPEQVQKLAKFGANNVAIADFFGCDEGTIRKGYSESLTKGRAERKITLHQRQYEAAEAGNIAMLIWLGKQDLGQADKTEHKTEVTTIVQSQKQRAMLRSERAFELACDLEREIIAAAPTAYESATRDDPGGIRPPGQ